MTALLPYRKSLLLFATIQDSIADIQSCIATVNHNIAFENSSIASVNSSIASTNSTAGSQRRGTWSLSGTSLSSPMYWSNVPPRSHTKGDLYLRREERSEQDGLRKGSGAREGKERRRMHGLSLGVR